MEYIKAHIQTIDGLREVGVWLGYEDRIPTFWLRHYLVRLYPPENVAEVISLLDRLVELRKQGKEPPTKGGKYDKKDLAIERAEDS